jgi:CBS domain containing-hemolysin-like protein
LPYDTLSGLILKELGRCPKQGEKNAGNEFVMVCEEVTPTTIVKIKIIKNITKE